MKQFFKDVYVKETQFGKQATYIDNGNFIELRVNNPADYPADEGYYTVKASQGFRRYVGNTGKQSVYANGIVLFEKISFSDESLEA